MKLILFLSIDEYMAFCWHHRTIFEPLFGMGFYGYMPLRSGVKEAGACTNCQVPAFFYDISI